MMRRRQQGLKARLKGLGSLQILAGKPHVKRANQTQGAALLDDFEHTFAALRICAGDGKTPLYGCDISPRLYDGSDEGWPVLVLVSRLVLVGIYKYSNRKIGIAK